MRYLLHHPSNVLSTLVLLGLSCLAGSAWAQTTPPASPAFTFDKCLALYLHSDPKSLMDYLGTATPDDRKNYLFILFIARVDYSRGWIDAGDVDRDLCLAIAASDQFKPAQIKQISDQLETERQHWVSVYTWKNYQPASGFSGVETSNTWTQASNAFVPIATPASSSAQDNYEYTSGHVVKASSGYSGIDAVDK